MKTTCIYANLCSGAKTIPISLPMSDIIAAIALIVSILVYFENRKLRKDQGGAFIFVDILQMNSAIYAVVKNIGTSQAFNTIIKVNEPFANQFASLKLIQPGASYQYLLLYSSEVAEYPLEVIFSVTYSDRYIRHKKKEFRFNLSDYLRYEIYSDPDSNSYYINKSF